MSSGQSGGYVWGIFQILIKNLPRTTWTCPRYWHPRVLQVTLFDGSFVRFHKQIFQILLGAYDMSGNMKESARHYILHVLFIYEKLFLN